MAAAGPDITADSKLGPVLEQWPALEGVLVELSPRFRLLENPLLRRVLGRVATLRQIAIAGTIPVPVLLARMRSAAGLPELREAAAAATADERPQWARTTARTGGRDARVDLEAGNHPLPLVMAELEAIEAHDVYELITPFVPAPLMDLARRKGFDCHAIANQGEPFVRTYFRRATAAGS